MIEKIKCLFKMFFINLGRACAEICQCDIILPNPEKGKPPIVMFPGECYYCGACVMVCPKKGALRLQHPVMNRAKFVSVKPEPEN